MKNLFQLPPKGTLRPNDDHNDPLNYYYHPIVGYLYRQRVEHALSLLSPQYDSILEIGYGSGLLLPTLSRFGRKISGIDLTSDPDQTKFLLKKLGVCPELIKGDITKHDFPENSFDLIVAISVFEHIENPVPALRNISKALSANGFLLVGMPRVDLLMSKLFEAIGFSDIDNHHVLKYADFLNYSKNYFTLVNLKTMPTNLPNWASLYYNMLLKKADHPK